MNNSFLVSFALVSIYILGDCETTPVKRFVMVPQERSKGNHHAGQMYPPLGVVHVYDQGRAYLAR